jgi:hypothetical protein
MENDLVLPHLQRFDRRAEELFCEVLAINSLTAAQRLQFHLKMTEGAFGLALPPKLTQAFRFAFPPSSLPLVHRRCPLSFQSLN